MVVPPTPDLPTEEERKAYLLHTLQHLPDAEIGRLLGVRRETANRYRSACQRKFDALRVSYPEVAGPLIAAMTAVN